MEVKNNEMDVKINSYKTDTDINKNELQKNDVEFSEELMEKYAKEHDDNKFWKKMKKLGTKVGVTTLYLVFLLYHSLKSASIPSKYKTTILGSLGYFISPIDIIPDITPLVGYSDDVSIAIVALAYIAIHITDEIRQEAKDSVRKIFPDVTDEEFNIIDKTYQKTGDTIIESNQNNDNEKKLNKIKEICGDVSFNRIYNYANISQKKLNNIKSKLEIVDDEMILFYDSTILGSCKEGLAIGEKGIYWRWNMPNPRYLSWDEFKKVELTYEKTYICFKDEGRVYVYDTEVESLFNILNKIKLNIKVGGFFDFVKGTVNLVNKFKNEDESNNQSLNNEFIDVEYNEEYIVCDEETEFTDEINYRTEMDYNQEVNFNEEQLIQEIESVKETLKDINNDLIGGLVDVTVNNDEELQTYISDAAMATVALTGDKRLFSLFDEESQQDLIRVKQELDPRLELAENTLNSDLMNDMGDGKVSLKKSINLYNHRVKVVVEDYKSNDEYIEDMYDSLQIAVADFRKSLKNMIKSCNSAIEKFYMD